MGCAACCLQSLIDFGRFTLGVKVRVALGVFREQVGKLGHCTSSTGLNALMTEQWPASNLQSTQCLSG